MYSVQLALVNIIIYFMAARWKTVNTVIQSHKQKPEDPNIEYRVISLLDWFGVCVDLVWTKPHWSVVVLIENKTVTKAQLNNGLWGFNRTTVKALVEGYLTSGVNRNSGLISPRLPASFLEFSLMERIRGKAADRFIGFPNPGFILIVTAQQLSKGVRGTYSYQAIRATWDIQMLAGPLGTHLLEELRVGFNDGSNDVPEGTMETAVNDTIQQALSLTIEDLIDSMEPELKKQF